MAWSKVARREQTQAIKLSSKVSVTGSVEGSSGRARRTERSEGVLPGSIWTRALELTKTHLSLHAALALRYVRYGVEGPSMCTTCCEGLSAGALRVSRREQTCWRQGEQGSLKARSHADALLYAIRG